MYNFTPYIIFISQSQLLNSFGNNSNTGKFIDQTLFCKKVVFYGETSPFIWFLL